MPDIPLRVRYADGRPVPLDPASCEPHTPSPDSYLAWDAWVGRMVKTHESRQCTGCGLWAIWEPKEVPRG